MSERAQLERPARLTHIAIRAPQFEETIDFYQRYADLSIVHQREDEAIRVAWLSDRAMDPDLVMVLLEMPYEEMREPAPTDHFGFDVASREDVDRIAALGRAEGTLKHGPINAGPIVGYFVMVRDPSGNTCEFSFGQPIKPTI